MEIPNFVKTHFPESVIEDKKEVFSMYKHNGRTFVRMAHDLGHLLRGTVFWDKDMLYGYPRIRRILHLERGIDRYLREGFYAEEKMDGYNVRVKLVDGLLIAFTRGGFICPFTTERVSELLPARFFSVYPLHTLCGEVVGPENPYNTEVIPYMKEDLMFMGFDIMDGKGRLILPEEKYKVFEKEGINQVRHWGQFRDINIPQVKNLIIDLDRDEREGITLKPVAEGGKTLKYVTPSSCLRDIEATAGLLSELPAGFYMERMIRLLFFCHEFGIEAGDYFKDVAKALSSQNQKLLKELDEGGQVREFFSIRVRRKETVDALLLHLKTVGVRAHLMSMEAIGEYYKARFYRVFDRATKELRDRLRGHGFFD
ncbi:MAG: RNA ligase [Nitrospirae bacterium]|nr:RNA ligase [Nitrospirota bacterium]